MSAENDQEERRQQVRDEASDRWQLYLLRIVEAVPDRFQQPPDEAMPTSGFSFEAFGDTEPTCYYDENDVLQERLDGRQYILPGTKPRNDGQLVWTRQIADVFSNLDYNTNLRIPFIGSVDDREIRFRELVKKRSEYEPGSAAWLAQVQADLEFELYQDKGNSRSLTEYRAQITALKNRVASLERELQETNYFLAQAQQIAPPSPTPSEISSGEKWAARAVGAKIAYDHVQAADRQREAKRLISDIAMYAKLAQFDSTDFGRASAGRKVIELQAQLLALQVR